MSSSVRERVRLADPDAELAVPCKFHPRCRPRGEGRCRFAHVAPELRDEFFETQAREEREEYDRRVCLAQWKSTMKDDVLPELVRRPHKRTSVCLAVSYSYKSVVHGTEYVYPPVGFMGEAADVEAYASRLAESFPDVHIVSIRTAPVSAHGTADCGHPVRDAFVLPFGWAT